MSKHCPLGDREIGKALLLLRDREIERLQAENAALRRVVEVHGHELDTESDMSPGIERLRAALSALKEARG